MSRQTSQVIAPKKPAAVGTTGILQRKCASCGNHTGASGECTDCKKKQSTLQRKLTIGASNDPLEQEADRIADQVLAAPTNAATSGSPLRIQRYAGQASESANTAPASVERVLAGSGRPLEAELQQDMGQRFGYDFSSVRVHSDAAAAQSARAVNAYAYTAGHDIVFGAGEFAPSTTRGKRLLAHELVHVAQQGASVRASHNSVGVMQSRSQVARKGNIELEVDPNCPQDMMCFNILNGNMAHHKLTQQDKDAVLANVGGSVASGPGPSFSKDGPRFVLHDTATSFGSPKTEAKHLAELKAQDSTPLGEGAASYVTAAGAPERTHSKFFNARRPTATEFERGNDLMGLFARETAMQQIWSLTEPAEQSAAIARLLALFPNLSSKDVTGETKKAAKNLDSSQTTPSNKAGAKAVVMTTASGAVSQICDEVAARGAAKVAVKGQDAALATACSGIKPVYDARKTRIADTTNIEIIADKGSDCDMSASATPFSGYAPATYDAVAKLYALAALEAGQFPEITTHYFLDSTTPAGSPGPITKSQNRCDPRCFDLDLLYVKIAVIFNHLPGTTYGITPQYGTKFGTSNVWWPANVCGSPRGASAAGATSPPAKKKKSPPAKEKK